MAAWLPQPVMFQSSRAFDCSTSGFTPDQCTFYMKRWHFWYIADHVYALPTVAFFMCTIGIFIISYALTQLLATSTRPAPSIWRRGVAATRYLSYRGFHVKSLGWNTAPIGVLILGAIGTIYFFCMDLASSPYYWPGPDSLWGHSPPLGTRSGWLALACMPFVFATASKANWITLVTGVPHEKLQVFHRWIAYAFLILALMHTFPFIVWHIRNGDMVSQFTEDNIFEYWTGVVAILFQAWLTFASWGPVRTHLGYEFFKAAHFFSAVVFVVVFFWHCAGTLTSWDYFVATAAVYVPCWAYPWFKTIFEYGVGQKAQVCVEENGFIRLTIPANFLWQPGQHCFLRFRGFGLHCLSAHPFTICSLPSISPDKKSEITFYIRHRTGFTARLYNRAMQQPGLMTPVLVDGPYGGIDNQKYFDSNRLVVAAGGSGAGWILPFIEQFLRYNSTRVSEDEDLSDNKEKEAVAQPLIRRQGLHGPKSLRVILATRDVASRTWFHTAFTNLLLSYYSSTTHPDIKVEVHLTGDAEHIVRSPAKSERDLERSDSSSIGSSPKDQHAAETRRLSAMHVPDEEVRGRPDLPAIIREEASIAASRDGQNLGVFVCGPLSMQDDVRNAVAKENLDIVKSSRPGGVYLHLEHFSWA